MEEAQRLRQRAMLGFEGAEPARAIRRKLRLQVASLLLQLLQRLAALALAQRAILRRRQCPLHPQSQSGRALGSAADQAQVQIVDVELAFPQPCKPLPVQLSGEARRDAAGQLGLHPPPHDVLPQRIVAPGQSTQQGIARALEPVQLLGVLGLEGLAIQLEHLHQVAVARFQRPGIDLADIGDVPRAAGFPCRHPRRRAAPGGGFQDQGAAAHGV